MARPSLLTPDSLATALSSVPAWTQNGSTIERIITAQSFAHATALFVQIGFAAETLDHHPDMLLYGWNKLRITLSTHDQGGLTELDFTLAKRIDAIVS